MQVIGFAFINRVTIMGVRDYPPEFRDAHGSHWSFIKLILFVAPSMYLTSAIVVLRSRFDKNAYALVPDQSE